MKKNKLSIILVLASLFTMPAFAQVGIGLANSHGTLQIDGGTNDNTTGLPTAAQEADDVIVNTNGQMGIGTVNPTTQLHVKAASNPLRLEGLSKSSLPVNRYLVVDSITGIVRSAPAPSINIAPDGVGTVIALNKQLIVAQEITCLLTANNSYPGTGGIPGSIPRILQSLTNVVMDNYHKYVSDGVTNSFTVVADGVYSIIMNLQISIDPSQFGTSPVIGIWCDTAPAGWVARANDDIRATAQTYTLITTIPMFASKTYSFRVSNTGPYGVNAFSSGNAASGPMGFVSVKRLK